MTGTGAKPPDGLSWPKADCPFSADFAKQRTLLRDIPCSSTVAARQRLSTACARTRARLKYPVPGVPRSELGSSAPNAERPARTGIASKGCRLRAGGYRNIGEVEFFL
jgi:hypothetical protein